MMVNIRQMSMDDLETVQAIDKLSFSLPWPANAYRHELTQNPSSLCRVAEVASYSGMLLVVGMAVVWLVVDEAHIATLAVHPDFRRQGIARQLLARLLLESIKKGMIRALLEVRRNNLAAQALYAQFGFTIAGRRKNYYHDNNEDALLMNLDRMDTPYLGWLEDMLDVWANE